MDAVAADHDVTLDGHRCGLRPRREARHHALRRLGETVEAVSRLNRGTAKSRYHGVTQDALQLAAVDRKLRHTETCVHSPRLMPDTGSESVQINEFPGAHTGSVQRVHQPQRGQHLNRMREGIDTHTEFADLRRLLEDHRLHTRRMQGERGGQTGDAASDDDDFQANAPQSPNRSDTWHGANRVR